MLVYIFLIFFVFNNILLESEISKINIYSRSNFMIKNKIIENSSRLIFDNNENSYLINFNLELEVLSNNTFMISNNYKVQNLTKNINKTNFISYENFIIRITNFSITSNDTNSLLKEEGNLYNSLKSYYLRIRWKYFLQIFLLLSTFVFASLFIVMKKSLLFKSYLIYEYFIILIQINLINYLQICFLLIEKIEIFDDQFQIYSINNKSFFTTLILIAIVSISFFSFLWNFLLLYKTRTIFISFLFMLSQELLTNTDFQYLQKNILLNFIFIIILFLFSIWIRKLSIYFENEIKTKINRKEKEIQILKESFNFLNIPIININSEANFICNQTYIEEIISNNKFDHKFEVFDKLNKIYKQIFFENDDENLIKFFFLIHNFDINYKNEENLNSNESFIIKINQNDDGNLIDKKLVHYKAIYSIFKLKGADNKEDLIDLFSSYKSLIEENLQELGKEMTFYDLISNNKSRNRKSQKLIIRKNCQSIIELIGKINVEFISNFGSLINKFKIEKGIEEKEYLKIGEMIIIKNNEEMTSDYRFKQKDVIYDIYARYNIMNQSLEFTMKINIENTQSINYNSYYEKREESCLEVLLPQLIKKICHEIRNPVINILQLVKEIKSLNLKEKDHYIKIDANNQDNSNLLIEKENIKEENNDILNNITINSNINSNRLISLDRTLSKNTVHLSFSPLFNNIADYMNLIKNINIDDSIQMSSNLNLNLIGNNNINFNFNNNNNIENYNTEKNTNSKINKNIVENSKYNIDNTLSNIDYENFKLIELQKNLKKIKYLSKMINFTSKEFEFVEEIIIKKHNKSLIIENIREQIKNSMINLNFKSELKRIKKFIDNIIEIKQKKMKFEISFDENFPDFLNVDIDFVEIIIYNLISNAIKFSFSGNIILKVFYNQDYKKICFNIIDQGIGIKQENLELIGKFMYKINNRNNEYGLGIGIFYVKLIIEALEGNLIISSKIGEGTNIYIDFKNFESIEKLGNKINNLYDEDKNTSPLLFNKSQKIWKNFMDNHSLERFNYNKLVLENSSENELKLLKENINRNKSAREINRAKFTELTDINKLYKKFGEKYNVFVNSTNNIIKFSPFKKIRYGNFILKNKNSSFSDKETLRNLAGNINSNFQQIQDQSKENYKNVGSLNYKDIASQTSLDSCEPNPDKLNYQKTDSYEDSRRINKIPQNRNINPFSGITKPRKSIFSEHKNVKKYFNFDSNNFPMKQSNGELKKLNSLQAAYKGIASCQINESSDYSLINNTINQFNEISNHKNFLYNNINENKDKEIKFSEIYSRKMSSNSNKNSNSDHFEKKATIHNSDINIRINYNEIQDYSKLYIPRKSRHSITSPKNLYQNSKNNSSSIENSPMNYNRKLRDFSSIMQTPKNNTEFTLYNKNNMLKNSLFLKQNFSILVSNRNTINVPNDFNLDKYIENNSNLKYNVNNSNSNKSISINECNDPKFKDTTKIASPSTLGLIIEPGLGKKRTLKFLIVDDEALIRKSEINIIMKYFKKKDINIELTECSDGVECLYKLYDGLLNGIRYDMIFTDETMNFIRGTAMARIVKSLIKENILYDLKIFMITSYDKSILTDRNGNIQNDIDFFSSKPLSLHSLEKLFSKLF